MASKNEFTGDLQQTKGRLSEEGRANYDLAFPPKAVKRGRYKQCRDTGKFIPISEWNALYASDPVEKGPLVIMKGFDAFKSPTSGEIISNNRQLDYDMAKSGCRQYEGLAAEQKEVDKFVAEEDAKLYKGISDSVDETAYQIEHNYSRPEADTHVKFSLGDDDE